MHIVQAVHAISAGEMSINKGNSRDEISAPAAAFNRRKTSLTIAIEMLQRQA